MKKHMLLLLVLLGFCGKAMYKVKAFSNEKNGRVECEKRIDSWFLQRNGVPSTYKRDKEMLDMLRGIIISSIEDDKIGVNSVLKSNFFSRQYTLLDLYGYLGFPDLKAIKYLVENGANINKETDTYEGACSCHTGACAIFTSVEKRDKEFECLFKTLQYFVLNGASFSKKLIESLFISDKVKTYLKNVLLFKESKNKTELFFRCCRDEDNEVFQCYLCLMISEAIKKINELEMVNFNDMSLYKLYQFVQSGKEPSCGMLGATSGEIVKSIFKCIGLDVRDIDFKETGFVDFLKSIFEKIRKKKIEDRQFAFVDQAYKNLFAYLDQQEATEFLHKKVNEWGDKSMGRLMFPRNKKIIKYPKGLLAK